MANGISRSFKWVTVIHELEPNLFLFGTLSDSLYLYDMKKETVRNLSTELQPDPKFEKLGNITAITQDNEGYVWIATNKNGLYRLNRNLKLAKHYQKKDGLSDSYINSLTIDQHQNIWVTTGKSIYKLNRTTDTFSEMRIADTPAMEFTRFSGNSISADGSIYFPGDKGVLFFNPDKIMVNPNIPPVDITSLIVNNKDDVTGNIEDGEITLTSDQNNITFRYTALNFIHSERNPVCLQAGRSRSGMAHGRKPTGGLLQQLGSRHLYIPDQSLKQRQHMESRRSNTTLQSIRLSTRLGGLTSYTFV